MRATTPTPRISGKTAKTAVVDYDLCMPAAPASRSAGGCAVPERRTPRGDGRLHRLRTLREDLPDARPVARRRSGAVKERYDVIVIGAGPAGSTAARRAAENGLDVLLIEKRREIGAPVRCAEATGLDSLSRTSNRMDAGSTRTSAGSRSTAPPADRSASADGTDAGDRTENLRPRIGRLGGAGRGGGAGRNGRGRPAARGRPDRRREDPAGDQTGKCTPRWSSPPTGPNRRRRAGPD